MCNSKQIDEDKVVCNSKQNGDETISSAQQSNCKQSNYNILFRYANLKQLEQVSYLLEQVSGQLESHKSDLMSEQVKLLCNRANIYCTGSLINSFLSALKARNFKHANKVDHK